MLFRVVYDMQNPVELIAVAAGLAWLALGVVVFLQKRLKRKADRKSKNN